MTDSHIETGRVGAMQVHHGKAWPRLQMRTGDAESTPQIGGLTHANA
jgi:hypothetical protein